VSSHDVQLALDDDQDSLQEQSKRRRPLDNKERVKKVINTKNLYTKAFSGATARSVIRAMSLMN
jgi:hypothetical protein